MDKSINLRRALDPNLLKDKEFLDTIDGLPIRAKAILSQGNCFRDGDFFDDSCPFCLYVHGINVAEYRKYREAMIGSSSGAFQEMG